MTRFPAASPDRADPCGRDTGRGRGRYGLLAGNGCATTAGREDRQDHPGNNGREEGIHEDARPKDRREYRGCRRNLDDVGAQNESSDEERVSRESAGEEIGGKEVGSDEDCCREKNHREDAAAQARREAACRHGHRAARRGLLRRRAGGHRGGRRDHGTRCRGRDGTHAAPRPCALRARQRCLAARVRPYQGLATGQTRDARRCAGAIACRPAAQSRVRLADSRGARTDDVRQVRPTEALT